MNQTYNKTFRSRLEAEDAMRRMEYPNMRVAYSRRSRAWVIMYGDAP